MDHLPDALKSFTAFHDQVIKTMAEAERTRDVSMMTAFEHPEYHGTYAGPGQPKPITWTGPEAAEAMQRSLNAGNVQRIENRVVRMRSATEAAVFFERVFEREGKAISRLFTLEFWKLTDGQWKLMRETVEQVAV